MNPLTEFINAANNLPVIIWLLLIIFMAVLTVFFIVRNSGADAKRSDDQMAVVFDKFQQFVETHTKTILEIQNKDRASFNRALEVFTDENRINREARERDYEYRVSIRNSVENALQENKAAVKSFETVLEKMTNSQTNGLKFLIEVRENMDAVIKAIGGYHESVLRSADTQQTKHIEALERIERTMARLDRYMNELIESKVKESKPDGSIT